MERHVEADSPAGRGLPADADYLASDGRQVDGLPVLEALLAAGQGEEGLDDPQNPSQVSVSLPSSSLTAQLDAERAFNTLFLGLGAVALLVGVANIMIISVLERRSEIGLRRALGATKGHIRIQFLSEAILLSLIGGTAGVGAGAGHWPRSVPPGCHPPRPCGGYETPGAAPAGSPQPGRPAAARSRFPDRGAGWRRRVAGRVRRATAPTSPTW